MRTYTKAIQGFEMKAYNDSGCEWVVQSVDSDGSARTERYSMKSFTMKHAFEFHASLYSQF